MSTVVLERRFAEIGARVKVEEGPWLGDPQIDVRSDRKGEYFDLSFVDGDRKTELEVIDALGADRHLLLLVRNGAEKSKFLCGHDERHWFVAAVPESARGVTGVASAKAALQPEPIRGAVQHLKPKDRFRRRNAAFVRQGEWFFVPEPWLVPDPALVLRNEPLFRGRGQMHVMQFAYRRGGDVVYVNWRNPAGITEARFRRLTESHRRTGGWTRMVRDADVFAKGAVRHPDHATIVLREWHRVLMNTEHQAAAMLRSGPGDLDLVAYSLRKYVRLALKGHPTILLLLFVPAELTLVETELGRELRELAPALLSRRAGRGYLGYLRGQKERLLGTRGQMRVNRPELVEAHGFDTKYAMHAARLGYQGVELMETGRLTLPMPEPERSRVMAIRTGELGFDEAIAEIDEVEQRLAQALEATALPPAPDRAAVDAFLVDAYRRSWGW